MLETIMCIAAIFAISFAVKNTDGPFGIMNQARLFVLSNQYMGVFFYGLLQCYFCLGAYSGILVYMLHQHFDNMNMWDMIMWALGGSTISLGINVWMEKKS